jgi:four helix bundle protein
MAKVFEDLECWELAADLDAKVFRLVKGSDIKNEFSLRNQMLSSSGSIADNIAEGFERGGNKEFMQFLYIAKGSCGELRSQIHRCMRGEMIDQLTHKDYVERCRKVSGKISNLISYLKTSEYKGNKFV